MKRRLSTLWENLVTPRAQPLPAGIYTLASEMEGKPYRLHLRLEADGEGILILNASTILHLNPTAAELAYHIIQQKGEEEIVAIMLKRYQIDETNARADYADFLARLKALITTPDLDPEIFLDTDRSALYSGDISAPYRLDCALTYLVSEPDGGEAPLERVKRELLTEEWKSILEKAWAAGIPHVVFTGGEPTLRPDLPELIAHAQQLGQVCGLLTDGLRLTESSYLKQLLDKGLDYIMLLLDPDSSQSWESLQDILIEDIALTVHVTLTPRNADQILSVIEKLAVKGVKAISLSASSPSLSEQMLAARQKAADLSLPIVWDLPVPYSTFHPVAIEAEMDIPRGAGKAWLYVEPDGDVLRGQGIPDVLGNMVNDSWDTIWSNAQKPA